MTTGNTLHLEIDKKCGKSGEGCNCDQKPGGIEARKETNNNAVGFVSFIHHSKTPFILSKKLDNGERLEGSDIDNVTEVSVYYWDEDKTFQKPLLIEVNNGESKPRYYLRHENGESGITDSKVWKRDVSNTGGVSLQALLDDRNCVWHNVIPFFLDEPGKGIGIDSNCAKSKTVEFVNPAPLSGSDYITTTYKINGDGTKISRVEHNKEKLNIPVPHDTLDGIRLYSSSINGSKIPVMIDFKRSSGGESTILASSSSNDNWTDITQGSNNLYTGKDFNDQKPTENLAKKLDEVVCSDYNGVTIDLTKTNSETHINQPYCCEKHRGRITVTTENISLTGDSGKFITAYKHRVEKGQSVAGIKFYQDNDQGQRRRIKSSKFDFPMEGPVDIYTFYAGSNPELIYVYGTGTNNKVRGWFRRDSSGYGATWKKTSQKLKNIKHKHIESHNFDCKQWTAIRGVLKDRGGDLEECTEPKSLQDSLGHSEDANEGLRQEPQDEADNEEEDGSEDEKSSDDSDAPAKSVPSSPLLAAPGKDGKADVTGKEASDSEAVSKPPETSPGEPENKAPAGKVGKDSGPTTPSGGVEQPYKVTTPNALLTVVDAIQQLVYAVLAPTPGGNPGPDGNERPGKPDESDLVQTESTGGGGAKAGVPGSDGGTDREPQEISNPGSHQEQNDGDDRTEPGSEVSMGSEDPAVTATEGDANLGGVDHSPERPPTKATDGEPTQEALKSTTERTAARSDSSHVTGPESPQPPEKLFVEAPLGLGVIVSSVFGGSGLTGFLGYKGYSLYKNFKGDPWVRQI